MKDTVHVKGLRELEKKLAKLGQQNAGKALRQAAMNATTPGLKAAKREAPIGKQMHRTYKGRLVAPGFLRRSIVRRSSYRNGWARVIVGVRKEAFYGVLFVEEGTKPHRIPKREKVYRHFLPRRNGPGVYVTKKSKLRGAWRKKALKINGRFVGSANHPGFKANPWLERAWEREFPNMVKRFRDQLEKKIERLSNE